MRVRNGAAFQWRMGRRAGGGGLGSGTSGLADAVGKLEDVDGFGTIRFSAADVVRHPIVGRIVEAYEGPDA